MDELAAKIIVYVAKLGADEVVSWWGVNDDLKKLDDTMRLIKAVLDVAEKRQAMGEADAVSKEWLRRLKKVLYRADDLFDDVFAVKHQTAHSLTQGSKLEQVTKKVLLPLSELGRIRFSSYVAGQIKSIRKELDAIKADSGLNGINLGLNDRHDPMLFASNHLTEKIGETSSFVNPINIVGREDDKNKIVEMLLSELGTTKGSISVIPIVGMGGIGKSTLAQLVFNDDGVKNHFDLTNWVWLLHNDNRNEVKGKIFTAFTNTDYRGLSLERLQSSICTSIEDKKYLLVLDNVWDESRDSWLDVMNFLCRSKRGSRIIVTTRSFIVAKNVGTFPNPYKMQLLSDEESWDLFQKVSQPGNNPNLIAMGKEIVKKCGNVPIVIRAIGSVLYGKDEEIEWTNFKDFQLSKIGQSGTMDVISLLKLSYDQLPSQLKQCFSYFASYQNCSRFTRNYTVVQWMAHGFVTPSSGDDNRNLEDIGQRYFETLLSRNFIQDAIPYRVDDIHFRVHDLMMDLARHIADDNKEIVVNSGFRADDVTEKLNDEIRHLCLSFDICDSWDTTPLFPYARPVRTLRLQSRDTRPLVQIHKLKNMLSNFISLRSLKLVRLKIESVPATIGQLRHLRLLLISSCSIKCLPSSIKRLWNLQTLILRDCKELAALPRGISRLTNLRYFRLDGCDLLTELPTCFGKLKSLRTLTYFIVGKNNGLDAMADMNLKGELTINYRKWRKDSILEARKATLKGKHLLKALGLQLEHLDNIPHDDAVSLLEELLPPACLKLLQIVGYQGERLPSWMDDGFEANFPELEQIELRGFNRCHSLSSGFHHLPWLKHLILSKLPELREWSRMSSEEGESVIVERRHDGKDRSEKTTFPCLETLEIYHCPYLISMPPAPKLQKLIGEDIHMRILLSREQVGTCFPCVTELGLTSVHGLDSLVINGMPLLKTFKISNCEQLIVIGVETPTSIEYFKINKCVRLREIQGLYLLSSCKTLWIQDCEAMDELPTNMDRLMSLESLVIWELPKLTALPVSISQLTTLDDVIIYNCPELSFLPDTFDNLTQIRRLQIGSCLKMSTYIESESFTNLLCRLTMLELLFLGSFPELKALPECIQHLPHLGKLKIVGLPEMKVLPHWLTKLRSLHTLQIVNCPHLEERCKKPDGQDWPLIRHIHNVSFN